MESGPHSQGIHLQLLLLAEVRRCLVGAGGEPGSF